MQRLTNRQKQAIATKLRIMEVAIDLFKNKGYENVKVQDICSAAGISVGAFYHHFDAKSEIVATGYKQVDRLLQERFESTTFDKHMDKIIFLFGEGALLMEEIGWHVISEVYKNLLSKNTTYSFSEERSVFVELKRALVLAHEAREIDLTTPAGDIAKRFLRTARGTIFDWCLQNGTYDLKEQILDDLALLLTRLLNKPIL